MFKTQNEILLHFSDYLYNSSKDVVKGVVSSKFWELFDPRRTGVLACTNQMNIEPF